MKKFNLFYKANLFRLSSAPPYRNRTQKKKQLKKIRRIKTHTNTNTKTKTNSNANTKTNTKANTHSYTRTHQKTFLLLRTVKIIVALYE